MSNIPIQHRGRFIEATIFLQQNIEYDASDNAIMVGYSAPGSLNSEAVWLIIRYYNNATGAMTESRFADASIDFNKIWDDRWSYEYSKE